MKGKRYGKRIVRHVISHKVSFFFLSPSFFINKEENHLIFENIGSFELHCSI